jgi:hypothetical protein
MVTIATTTDAEAAAMTELMEAAPASVSWAVWMFGRKIASRGDDQAAQSMTS